MVINPCHQTQLAGIWHIDDITNDRWYKDEDIKKEFYKKSYAHYTRKHTENIDAYFFAKKKLIHIHVIEKYALTEFFPDVSLSNANFEVSNRTLCLPFWAERPHLLDKWKHDIRTCCPGKGTWVTKAFCERGSSFLLLLLLYNTVPFPPWRCNLQRV